MNKCVKCGFGLPAQLDWLMKRLEVCGPTCAWRLWVDTIEALADAKVAKHKAELAQDLSAIPDDVIAKETGKRWEARRRTKSGGHNGGRPPGSVSNKPRCPCGANTLARAAARCWKCCEQAGLSPAGV